MNGYAEDLRQHLHYETDPAEQRYRQMNDGSTVAITTSGDVIRTNNGEAVQSTKSKKIFSL